MEIWWSLGSYGGAESGHGGTELLRPVCNLNSTGSAVAQEGRGSYQGGKERLRKAKRVSWSLWKAVGSRGKDITGKNNSSNFGPDKLYFPKLGFHLKQILLNCPPSDDLTP
ncbi:hypothetical protein DUI87_09062 [Hirundo rustica rustica]|uniref:Uncharacterized protein n=1 Tax=Hirundo rustica rustica TaxID=333673 RepID=A0A3M0KL52_HIRRU|nr:hypothetical protein DUI87_09062 [Hirundo rustica rustica]